MPRFWEERAPALKKLKTDGGSSVQPFPHGGPAERETTAGANAARAARITTKQDPKAAKAGGRLSAKAAKAARASTMAPTAAAEASVWMRPNLGLPNDRPPWLAGGNKPLPTECDKDWPRRWRNGFKIRVAFLGGDASVQARVQRWAKEWSRYANIDFVFGAPDPLIRVSFKPGGSWSHVGTDALHPSLKGKPTMNLGWLTPDTPDEEVARVVLHEFGHVLGAIHEHQIEGSGIIWDEDAVCAYYLAQFGWDEPTVRRNIFDMYRVAQLQYGEYDPNSIMQYAVEASLTKNHVEIPWNTKLSPKDMAIIAKTYPGRYKP